MTASTASLRGTRILVRRATPDDLPVVVTLRLALLREYHGHPMYEQFQPDARDRAFTAFERQLRSRQQAMFLARRADVGEPEGILRCVEASSSALVLPERYCFVTSVYVVPHARRSGLLRALLAAGERWARARGLPEMRLHSSARSIPAIRAWDALGFEVVEQVRRRKL